MSISTESAFGLAIVSMSAAVSPKSLWNGNGTGACRELAVQCIQLEIDVAELALYVRDIFGKLHVNVGVTGIETERIP